MKKINTKITKNGIVIIFNALLFTCNSAWAESDMQLMEKALKIREGSEHAGMDHSAHAKAEDDSKIFRGVFYGYLPCDQKDCDGIKMTLSLKQKNNYLLVTQYAKASSREYYDKGKYVWDEQAKLLTLTSKKNGGKRLFSIQDEAALVQLNSDGTPVPGNQKDYTLNRGDSIKTRQVHIH